LFSGLLQEGTDPQFAVGEFWDSLRYSNGNLEYDQDAHRQRIVDWLNDAGGDPACAFKGPVCELSFGGNINASA
jgi:hypothetical protein